MNPFNSPLEIGVRVLAILESAYPNSVDIDRILLLDHGTVHSSDFGGPPSLHPGTPEREGELGLRRQSIEDGLRVLIRAKLVEPMFATDGIKYQATEDAYGFIRLLEANYVQDLRSNAEWSVRRFIDVSDEDLKESVRRIANQWAGGSGG